MTKSLLIVLLCLFVVGVHTVLLAWFLRKLQRIEEARWGKKADASVSPSFWKRITG